MLARLGRGSLPLSLSLCLCLSTSLCASASVSLPLYVPLPLSLYLSLCASGSLPFNAVCEHARLGVPRHDPVVLLGCHQLPQGRSSSRTDRVGTRGLAAWTESVQRLTEDHKPNRPDEKARVEAAGGAVEWCACLLSS